LVQNITYENTDTANPTLGSRTVRYVLTDGDGGTSANYDTTVTMAAVNDAPVNTVPGTQTVNEETQTAIAGISVVDVDAGVGTITTRLQVTAGVVDVTLFGAATISAGANSSNDLTILGTVADVNATLSTLLYTGNTNVTGVAADTLTVTTNDGGNTGTGGAQQDVDTIQINITPVNDAPVITSNGGGPTAAVNAPENQTAVTTVTATDVDVPADTLTYSIIGGADAALFSLDPNSGVLRFLVAPDFDAPTDAGTNNVYDVVVQVSDGNGGVDTQAIAVTVTDANDAPVITSNGAGPTAAVNVAENQTIVTTVTATDVDMPANTLTYTILGGADAALFSIDPASGVLTFTVPPDFETPTDADANNIYEVVVQVSDGNGGVDSQLVLVTVTDIQEGMPQPPTPQPGPTPMPAPSPRPTPESPQDTNTPSPGTPPIGFSDSFGCQPPAGRDLTRNPEPQSVHDWNRVLEVAPFLRPGAFGTTSDQIRAYAPAPVLLSSIELSRDFLQQLNSFADDLKETTQQTIDERSFFIKMMEYTGLGVSGILLAWLVRSGTLVASVLATLPAWRNFDPIAILDMDQKSREILTKKMREAAEQETREHQGLDRMLDKKIDQSVRPSSTYSSGSS
jgi:cadherin domain-containing protein/cadherin-like protein